MTFAADANPSPWPVVGISMRRFNSSAAKGCAALIKQWLATCDSEHDDCVAPDPGYVPRRVVEIGATGDTVGCARTLSSQVAT
jgi:hypothetical protein